MSKKTFKDIGSLAASAFINITPPKPAEQIPDAPPPISAIDKIPATRKPGRPRTHKRVLTKSSQENLPENWTRATFILREDLLADFKEHAAREGLTIKEAINDAIAQYLNGGNES